MEVHFRRGSQLACRVMGFASTSSFLFFLSFLFFSFFPFSFLFMDIPASEVEKEENYYAPVKYSSFTGEKVRA